MKNLDINQLTDALYDARLEARKYRRLIERLVDSLEDLGINGEPSGPPVAGFIEDTGGVNGGDTVDYMCKIYPDLKEALK